MYSVALYVPPCRVTFAVIAFWSFSTSNASSSSLGKPSCRMAIGLELQLTIVVKKELYQGMRAFHGFFVNHFLSNDYIIVVCG